MTKNPDKDEATHLLVQILAETDAIWLPMRAADWRPPAPANLWEARRTFAAGGILWVPGTGGDEAARKAALRLLDELTDGGLIERSGGERRRRVRLTDRGDVFTRALCGLPNVDAGHSSVREVLRLETVSEGDKIGPMVSELWLARLSNYDGSEQCKAAVMQVELLALPALWRGWIESRSDSQGRVYYAATDTGRAIAKKPEPRLPSGLPKSDAKLSALYDTEVVAVRARLQTQKPRSGSEIGYIPLPAHIALFPRTKKAKR